MAVQIRLGLLEQGKNAHQENMGLSLKERVGEDDLGDFGG